MRKPFPKWLLFVALALLLFLHNDVWLWDNPTLVLGLPAGLFYHVLYCFAAALMMAALVKLAWPFDLDEPPESAKREG